MRRGDVLIASIRGFAGKPRPAVVVQNDLFLPGSTVAICPMTSDDVGARFLRPVIDPDDLNRLDHRSWIMIDKVTVVELGRIGLRVGELSVEQMAAVDHGLAFFLGIVGGARQPA